MEYRLRLILLVMSPLVEISTYMRWVEATIATEGDIGWITAGENTDFSQGVLAGTITAYGDIGTVRTLVGYQEEVAQLPGTSLIIESQMGSIGSIEFDGGVTGTFTARFDIGQIQVSRVNGGDFSGSVTTAAGSIGSVTVHNGSMSATLTSAQDIDAVQALQDVSGAILAGGNVASVTATKGDITSTVEARGSIGDVTASMGNVTGSILAQVNIGDVHAGANIAGAIRAVTGSIGEIVAGLGGMADLSSRLLLLARISPRSRPVERTGYTIALPTCRRPLDLMQRKSRNASSVLRMATSACRRPCSMGWKAQRAARSPPRSQPVAVSGRSRHTESWTA